MQKQLLDKLSIIFYEKCIRYQIWKGERTKNYEFYDASLDLNLIPIFFIDYTLALTDTVP